MHQSTRSYLLPPKASALELKMATKEKRQAERERERERESKKEEDQEEKIQLNLPWSTVLAVDDCCVSYHLSKILARVEKQQSIFGIMTFQIKYHVGINNFWSAGNSIYILRGLN